LIASADYSQASLSTGQQKKGMPQLRAAWNALEAVALLVDTVGCAVRTRHLQLALEHTTHPKQSGPFTPKHRRLNESPVREPQKRPLEQTSGL
jgi:hypothetical protein